MNERKREAPQLKNALTSKIEKWNKLLVTEAVDNGSLNSELVKAYREAVADLEEIRAICDHRGRY